MKYFILIFLLCFVLEAIGQQEIDPDGYSKFYHPNGMIASEGTLRGGKPDGYWKTYNEKGILVSEGNRKNYLIDSTWKFYDDQGNLKMIINYQEGRKNGSRVTYRENEIIEENFFDDRKEGISTYYYPGGKIHKTIFYQDGLEEGIARVYDTTGNIIELITYKKGFITDRERINRYDANGHRHGKWKFFYESGALKTEGTYKHGIKHGYFKEYDESGGLISAAKFQEGEKLTNVQELKPLDVKTEYYPSGKVKIQATYKDDKPEGVWREYNEEGEIEKSFIFKNGVVIGEGIISEKGEKNGFWKEFFDNGILKAEGNYDKDIRTGKWVFYHDNGKIEQTGVYDDTGKPEGDWRWYYPSGLLLREETFRNGLSDGIMTEYDETGNIITQGSYLRGNEEGFWFYELGDHREEGEYLDGMRDGGWKYFYPDGTLAFKGRFVEDNPHGEHIYYWMNGNKRDEGYYVMGRKQGQWTSYNMDGTPFIVITYENGVEKKYDGIRITPEYNPEDFE
ncbi:MAG: hypothetical protein KKA81_14495 [Bacteroidetes bacterium]|nr:hypothetical protein [Bacteroidota bacterium]